MSEQTKMLVPKLRFPEFQDSGEWGLRLLGEIAKVVASGDLDSTLFSPIKTITHIVPVYSNAIEKEGLYGYYLTSKYPKDSISITARGNLGHAFHRTTEFMGIGRLIVAYDFKNDVPSFVKECWNYLVPIPQEVTSIPQLTAVAAKAKLLPLPVPKEQKKIADCLSSVDNLISAQTQKIAALKDHKKGLMQQLFPAEGETVPKLRFPEFKNAGEWRAVKFGEAATFINGKAYKQEELLDSGKYPVLRVGNFFTSNHWYYSNLELDPDKYCDRGDLLYAWSASFGPRIWNGDKSIYHYHIWKVLPKNGINLKFLYILLDSETERMKSNSSNGLGLLHITKGTIEGWNSYVPSLPEQEKISNFILSIDDLINLQIEKLSKLKVHKKGLMQQMFPMLSNEVVNG